MPAVNCYSINVSDASGTGDGPYTATVMKNCTAANTPTAPSVTTGPLGSSGTAAATQRNGAGSSVGFNNLREAIQKAIVLIENDKVLNNT